jgi:SAM-dependent methyltransferase
MAWYREWFGDEYLELYAHRGRDEAAEHVGFLLGALAPERPQRVLDLACGAGRHAENLRLRGVDAVGIDLSLTLLVRGADYLRVAGDMRRLPFRAGAFDCVVNFFTSFGYFEDEAENQRVLDEIARVLARGGRFLIDLLNAAAAVANLKPRGESTTESVSAELERWYDPVQRRLNKRIRLRQAGAPLRTFLESVRIYEPEEITRALEQAGLAVTERFGGFDREPYTRDSERLILLGRKAA